MRLRRLWASVVIVAALLFVATDGARAQPAACPKPPIDALKGVWALAATWQPGFCETYDTRRRPLPKQCPSSSMTTTFTLHGLWPQWAEYCSTAAPCDADRADMPAVALSPDLLRRLRAVMPGTASQAERYQHFKHGSCSGMTTEAYFTAAVDLLEKLNASSLPAFINANAGRTVTKRQLCRAIGDALGEKAVAAAAAAGRKHPTPAGPVAFYLTELRFWLRPTADGFDLSGAGYVAIPKGARTLGSAPADPLCDDNLDRHTFYIDRPGMGQ